MLSGPILLFDVKPLMQNGLSLGGVEGVAAKSQAERTCLSAHHPHSYNDLSCCTLLDVTVCD